MSVKIFNHENPVRVNVKLVDLRENMITSVSEEVMGSGTLILKVNINIGHVTTWYIVLWGKMGYLFILLSRPIW